MPSLIDQAFADLQENPVRVGVKASLRELHIYALAFSTGRIAQDSRIARPRHLVVFRHDETKVEVVRLLHDAMDLPTRLT